jgi:hypothetical protein
MILVFYHKSPYYPRAETGAKKDCCSAVFTGCAIEISSFSQSENKQEIQNQWRCTGCLADKPDPE